MRLSVRIALILAISLVAVFSIHAHPGKIIGSIPIPCTTPTGLTFDGTNLWVADRLTDTLYAVNPENGEVNLKLPASGFIPRGLAFDGSYLWAIDAENGTISQTDPESGITINMFDAPTRSPQGLTWDGQYLWISDDREEALCQISPEDGTTIKRFRAPMDYSTGLTFWNGYLWCGDRKEDRIYLIDPYHEGEALFSIDAPGKHVRGLATDGEFLFCVDYQDDLIYKLIIEDDEPIQVSDSHNLDLLLTHEFRNYGPGSIPELNVYIAIPDNMANQKILSEPKFSLPYKVVKDRWEQPTALFVLEKPAPAKRYFISMNVTAELSKTRHFVFPHKVESLDKIPSKISKTYLVDEEKYRINDPLIVKAAQEAIDEETNPYWQMRNIHRYIRERLHYELSGGWNVAPRVLSRGNGSCSEYTFLFISMCRSVGIPARYVGAVVIRGDEASADEVFHRWSQVYLPGYGWVHIDPQGGDKDKPGQVAGSIGVISERFLITTVGGGNSDLLAWNYNYNAKWTAKGPVKVYSETVGEWSPAKVEE